jgi:hypothetical protein
LKITLIGLCEISSYFNPGRIYNVGRLFNLLPCKHNFYNHLN